MKEFNVNNCYKLYEDKFGESIQEPLENTIRESQTAIEAKLEGFIKNTMQDPVSAENLNNREETKAKRILSEIIRSKNHLLSFFDSPYLHLYTKYKENPPELARWITWHWLSSPPSKFPVSDPFKYEKLKEILTAIGYHSSIYYFNDYISSYIEESDPTISWPKKEQLELYRIDELNKQLDQQKQLLADSEVVKNNYSARQEKIISKLRAELDQKKEQLSLVRAELELLKGPYFFHEDNLFKDYVFGDILPELKFVYQLLKEHKLYNSNWSYFCYCLTWYNASSRNSPQLKLSFNIQKSDFYADDLGYILQLLKNHYLYEAELPFIQWVMYNIEIVSGHGKKFSSEDDYLRFNEKSIRSYRSGKSSPQFYAEINEKLSSLL